MEQKLILLDIDGTLTRPGENQPPRSAMQAVEQARDNGHKVALCSGRNRGMLAPLLRYGFDGLAASAGGYIECGGKAIYDCPMSAGQQKAALEVFLKNDLYCTIEARDNSYADDGIKGFLQEIAGEKSNSELVRWREQIEKGLGIRSMNEYGGEPLYKICFMCRDSENLREPMTVLEREFQFCIQGADEYGIINGELINRKFNKGTAVEKLAEHFGIPMEDTIAFGDSMNDLEMLQTAAMGVCMENGNPKLKELADFVCPSVEKDGLYEGFRQLGLI